MKSNTEQQKDPAGWKGSVYYPDSKNGCGFGIEVLPDGRVWFPMIKPDAEKSPTSLSEKENYQATKNPPEQELSTPWQALDSKEGCYKLPGVDNYQGKVLPNNVTDKIKALIDQGLSTRAIAKQTRVSNVTVYRIARQTDRCRKAASKGKQLTLVDAGL
jgi:hypothetical protein